MFLSGRLPELVRAAFYKKIVVYNARMISSCMLAEMDDVLHWDFPVCE